MIGVLKHSIIIYLFRIEIPISVMKQDSEKLRGMSIIIIG